MHGYPPAIAAYLLCLAALLGLIMGSFCNNWAFRLCRGKSVARGRSRCPHCGHTLAARDLVPLVSWLCLRGKCRYCAGPISRRYPIAELLSAAGYVALILCVDPVAQWPELLRWAVLLPLLLTLSLQDWESWELSDGLVLAGAIWAVLLLPFSGGLEAVLPALLGGVSIAGPLLLFSLMADKLMGVETMGGGDIKLFAMLGLHLGSARSLLTVILACILGILLALIPRSGGEDAPVATGRFHAVPFGPAICLAAVFAGLLGERLISWYTALFFIS